MKLPHLEILLLLVVAAAEDLLIAVCDPPEVVPIPPREISSAPKALDCGVVQL